MKNTIAILIVALLSVSAYSAVAPKSEATLKKDADLVITGTVTAVTSKTQKSNIEKAVGVHRDRVYTITVKVASVVKGTADIGKEISFTAWKPTMRMPALPGPQGHSNIPTKGQNITVYLEKTGTTFKPILPNGIIINPPAKK